MTREEAIAIIRKEYQCVDRDCDIERSCGKCDLMMPSKEPILKAYKMAIKALEQEPCEDCINRQAVNTLVDEIARAISDERCFISRGRSTTTIMQDILDLPSVTPQEPKIGHWIDVDGVWFKCSECDAHRKMSSGYKEYFCPNCGAKMESEG